MRKLLEKPHFRSWLAMLGIITILTGTMYVLAQQSARSTADDRPNEITAVAIERLKSGADPSEVIPEVNANLPGSSIPFLVVTNQDRIVLASSLDINGNLNSLPPKGVFDNATAKQNKITWQPKPGVRLAISVTKADIGGNVYYVLAGQSLQPTEDRISNFGVLAIAGWVAAVSWVTLVYFFAGHLHEQNSKVQKSGVNKS